MSDDPHDFAFTHARLLVTNYRDCFRFYRDSLGFDVTWGDIDGVYADFDTGETTLALFDRTAMAESIGNEDTPAQASQQDEVAIVLRVPSVDETFAELRSDVRFINSPHDRPGWGIRVVHFRDPDGTLLEINQPIPDE